MQLANMMRNISMFEADFVDNEEVVLFPLTETEAGRKVPIRHLYTSIDTPMIIDYSKNLIIPGTLLGFWSTALCIVGVVSQC